MMIAEQKVREFKNSLKVGMKITAHGLSEAEVIGLFPQIVLLKTGKRTTSKKYNELVVGNAKIIG